MPRRAFRLIMLCLCLATIAAPPCALAQQGQQGRQEQAGQEQRKGGKGSSMSPREAAAKAQARHGGRVLKVTPKGSGYRVRLLKDDGRVVTVTIGG